MTNSHADLLDAYDRQLRGEAEIPSAIRWERDGGLLCAVYRGGRGFVTHDVDALAGMTSGRLDTLVGEVVARYRQDPQIVEVEWKTRAHDEGDAELRAVLTRHGFVGGEAESVMVGRAQDLAVDVPLPPGVTLRRIHEAGDVHAMAAMQDEVFGGNHREAMAEAFLERLAQGEDDMELWVAECDGDIICAGRIELVPGTDFAGIWGGSTRQEWRGRGIYRALTSARARSALARGKTLIQSDSTEFSRPILERSGLVRVTTTTPYEWRRDTPIL